MNAPTVAKSSPPSTRPADLPGPSNVEFRQRDIAAIGEVYLGLLRLSSDDDYHLVRSEGTERIARAELVLENAEGLRSTIAEMRRPATRKELGALVAALLAGFPQAGKADPAFARVLIEDIAAKEPTIGALDDAVRTLRRSSTFLPAIAEVIEALDRSERNLANSAEFLDCLPELVADLRKKREDEISRREREQLADARRWLNNGNSPLLREIPEPIVEKARALNAAEATGADG